MLTQIRLPLLNGLFVSCGLLTDLLCCLPAEDFHESIADHISHIYFRRIHQSIAQLRIPSASRVSLVLAEAVFIRASGCCLDIVQGVDKVSLCQLLTYSVFECAASLKPTGL